MNRFAQSAEHGELKIKTFFCVLCCRYRQILEKALQLTDTEQLEALKAFVEASKFSNTNIIRYDNMA